jgi:hypothetical protein
VAFNVSNHGKHSASIESISLCVYAPDTAACLYVCMGGRVETDNNWQDQSKWKRISLTRDDDSARERKSHRRHTNYRLGESVVVAKGATIGVRLEGLTVETDSCSQFGAETNGMKVSKALSNPAGHELCVSLPFGDLLYRFVDGNPQCRVYARGSDFSWQTARSFAKYGLSVCLARSRARALFCQHGSHLISKRVSVRERSYPEHHQEHVEAR